ncbi:MAG: CapA family protein [Planctomycetia bacterium]|nr:CapA family protein [Planctomycetia bacterium]
MMQIKLFGEVRAIPGEMEVEDCFLDADLTICNLETPITETENSSVKTGVRLRGRYDDFIRFVNIFKLSARVEKKQNFVFTLANNHIGDYGPRGIGDTEKACKKAGVAYGGVSVGNRQDPVLVETDSGKVAIFCVGERQFGVSRENVVGMDYLSAKLYTKIHRAKTEGYFVILSVHAAAEMNLWPAPLWQETLRSFIDAGVDVIHGHHSRVPQGWEEYHGGLIFYGLGNFLGPVSRWKRKQNALWGLSAVVEMVDGKINRYEMVPLRLQETDGQTRVSKINPGDADFSCTQDYLQDANYPLEDSIFLESLWQEFSMKMHEKWFAPFMGIHAVKTENIGIRKWLKNVIYSLIGKKENVFSEDKDEHFHRQVTIWYHWFSCQTHRLTAETALGILCGEIPDMRNDKSAAMIERYFQMF